MKLHPQLARQLKRAFGLGAVGDVDAFVAACAGGTAGALNPQGLTALLARINESYEAYERDVTLRTRSLELSSAELGEANERLVYAYEQQQRAIASLHAAAARLSGAGRFASDDDSQDVGALAQLMSELALERDNAARRLRESEQRLTLALVASGTALWDRDMVSGMVFVSEQWSKLLDRKVPSPAPAEVLVEMIHPEDAPAAQREFDRHVRGETEMFEVLARYAQGSGRWIWCRVCGRVVERDAEGRAMRAIGTLQDVTAQVEAQEALRVARDAAESASRAKSQFLATMSHEIRTPMNGVIGVVDLLAETGLSPEQAHYVNILHTSGEALLAIINDVLDFSRIEAGRLDLSNDDVDIVALAAGVTDLFRAQASRKAIALRFDAEPDLPLVRCDPLRMRQILLNLVGNAVKFTETGEVRLAVRQESETAERLALRIAVTDTGPGIAPEVREQIFAPFVQADGTTTRRHGGSGLGLAISKRLIEMMGGQLELASEVGRGSVFSVVIALPKIALCAPDAVRPVARAARRLDGLRVLVVEDNPLNQTIVGSMLRGLGVVTEMASNGREGVERARSGHYDVILMDCLMPEMDGFDATRAIRADEHATGRAHRPIIALTANAFQEDVRRCLDAGMDSHLSKPIRREQLQRALAEHAQASEQTPAG